MKQDIKYQNIIYYKYDGHESITSKDNIKIDFSKSYFRPFRNGENRLNVEYHHICNILYFDILYPVSYLDHF